MEFEGSKCGRVKLLGRFLKKVFSGCVESPVEMESSWSFSFTVRECLSVATWSDKVEDLKFALLVIKVMFVRHISFSFSSCDFQIVQTIFLLPPETVTKSQGNFSFHRLIVEFFWTFLSISIKFYSSEKNLDSTSFNFWKVNKFYNNF